MLYALASGTGGFVIVNTNDLLGGMQKIGKEQNEYYILGYVPRKNWSRAPATRCKVKVDKGGASVRYRTGYCDAKIAGCSFGNTDAARTGSAAHGERHAHRDSHHADSVLFHFAEHGAGERGARYPG